MLSLYAESIPSQSKDNQHQPGDSSLPVKVLLAALSSAQDSPGEVSPPLAVPTQKLDYQGQANEQMIALVEAIISKQTMANSHGSQEKLERAFQQLFDMPSFPIVCLYPNDG